MTYLSADVFRYMSNEQINAAPSAARESTATSREKSATNFTLLDDNLDEGHTKRGRRWPWFLIILLLLAVGGGYFWIKKGKAEPAPTYNTADVTRGDITQTVTANGQITPVKTVTVGSQVSGMITKLMADYNSQVTNGQIIAQLDPSTYQQLLVQAEADLSNAQAVLSLAEINFRRAKELQEAAANPRAELESAEAALKQAQATVKSREAALNKAKVDLERTTIYSPIDGLVISRAVDVGQTVAASLNAPTLFTIAKDLREMRIEASVSEADVGGVAEGQSVRFTVDAFPNNVFNGSVSQLRYEPRTNQNVVSYITVVDVRNDDLKLRPGMTANASIVTAEREDVIRVPNAALRFRPPEDVSAQKKSTASGARPGGTNTNPGGAAGVRPSGNHSGGERRGKRSEGAGSQTRNVYLLVPGANDAPATLKPAQIKVGVSDGTWTEVLDGLHENDVVVTGIKQTATTKTATAAPGMSPFGGGMRGPR